jgi:REP element-mobilizing transposase RayT
VKDQWKNRGRKSPRLQGYDYTQGGAYFITICTHQRLHLFGEIINGEMKRNAWGQIAAACWDQIPNHYPHVHIDSHVVMPNHVHGILCIINDPKPPPGTSDRRTSTPVGTTYMSSTQTPPPPNTPTDQYRPTGAPSGSIGVIVGTYRAAVTRSIRREFPDERGKIWQARYHDHIIRDEQGFNKIREYVLHNPELWQDDMFFKTN